MCNHCTSDPRDEVGTAASALVGLLHLLAEGRSNGTVPVDGLAALCGLIEDRLSPAAQQLQDYVPRGLAPPNT